MNLYGKTFIFVLAVCVFSWARSPRTHRGFYFSFGAGPSYSSAEISGEYDDRYYGENSRYIDAKVSENIRFSGDPFPAFDFRFGKSFWNLMVLYSEIDLSLQTGTLERNRKIWSVEEAPYLIAKERFENKNAFGGSAAAGLGFAFYPFLRPDSPVRGLHFGQSVLFGGNYYQSKKSRDRIKLYSTELFNSFEIGMDWWMSDTWSIGTEFSYRFAVTFWKLPSDFDEGKGNVISLKFRITRG